MLCGHSSRTAVESSEDNGAAEVASGHVVDLGGGVDDVVHGLHGEVHSHKLYDWSQPVEASANSQTGESALRDGSVYDALRAVLFPETLADLVRALVLGDLLAHEEDVGIASDFLVHGGVESISYSHLLESHGRRVECSRS